MLELLEYSFFRNALAGVLLLSIGAGILSTYIVTRRMVSIAGGITHACFGGLDWVTSSGSRRCSWRRFCGGVGAGSAGTVVARTGPRGLRHSRDMGVRHGRRRVFVFMTPGAVPELNSFFLAIF